LESLLEINYMHFALLSLASPPQTLTGQLSFPNKAAYCARHGYDFIGAWENPCPDRPASWGKIPMILQALPRYDAVFWSDADSLVTNPTTTLESIIGKSTADILIALDDPRFNKSVQCGQFIVRNTPAAAAFLSRVWEEFPPPGPWWEQSAMISLIERGVDRECGCVIQHVPRRMINSFPWEWRPSDFICHWTGDPGRVPKMKGRLNAIASGIGLK
jgi:hypothetical protein